MLVSLPARRSARSPLRGHVQRYQTDSTRVRVEITVANVYIEPVPEGTGFTAKYIGGQSLDGVIHRTQETAIGAAKRAGHQPLVSRVRQTDRGKPDQWRKA